MGNWGWYWLSDDVAKLESIRDMLADDADKAEIERVIAIIKSQLKDNE